MTLDTPSFQEAISHLEERGELFLEQPERLKVIKEQLAFYPQSNDEATRIVTLIGRGGQEYPTLRHLDEEYAHQRKAHADAPAAVRSIVHQFEDYAGNAVNEPLFRNGAICGKWAR